MFRQYFENLFFSFPVQLMLLHLKKHHLLLLFWVILFGIVAGDFAEKLGIPYLFLDPEYMGKVNFWSFFILGSAFGIFVMTWNMTNYILNSFRFPFLAALKKPFAKYCINNIIIPIIFVIVYFYNLLDFHSGVGFHINLEIITQLLGFLLGMSIFIILSFIYFFNTNKDIFKMFGLKEEMDAVDKKLIEKAEKSEQEGKHWRVDFFLSNIFKSRRVRKVHHYPKVMLRLVFRQHHSNALVFQVFILAILLALGYLIDFPAFRIPAGATMLLLFSVLLMFLGAFSFWVRGWRTLAFIGLILLVNILVKSNILNHSNEAYGLDYDKAPVIYDNETLNRLSNDDNIRMDIQRTEAILNNWRSKFPKNKKPKLIIINTSGGGLRSAVWTMNVMKKLDDIMKGELMNQTVLIAGASAGMIGSSLYRELYLCKKGESQTKYCDRVDIDNMAKDILNPVSYTLAVNDIFFPWQEFEYGGHEYSKDRGYMFEKVLSENTVGMLDKKMIDYTELERKADIPMMVYCPNIINDGRKLFIAAQPISYLTKPILSKKTNSDFEIDAVEFMKLFKLQDADSVKFTSVLRMNATFPYINPIVNLPSSPVISVMDAGMRDNFGIETTVRFLHVFQDWVNENSSGVIMLQIRDTRKKRPIKQRASQTAIDKILNPIGSFYKNWAQFQDYFHDQLIDYAGSWSKVDIDVIRFEYTPVLGNREVSLSWHLTKREKEDVINAIGSDFNEKSLKRFEEILSKQ